MNGNEQRPRRERLRAALRLLASDTRGGSDLTVHLLLTAAGAAMVCATLPSLFASSNAAARTFHNQVQVLERGADPTVGGPKSESGGSPWSFSFGPSGVSANGPLGSGIEGAISVGKGGVSGNVSGGGSSGGSPSSGSPATQGGGTGLIQAGGANAQAAQEALLHARTD